MFRAYHTTHCVHGSCLQKINEFVTDDPHRPLRLPRAGSGNKNVGISLVRLGAACVRRAVELRFERMLLCVRLGPDGPASKDDRSSPRTFSELFVRCMRVAMVGPRR